MSQPEMFSIDEKSAREIANCLNHQYQIYLLEKYTAIPSLSEEMAAVALDNLNKLCDMLGDPRIDVQELIDHYEGRHVLPVWG